MADPNSPPATPTPNEAEARTPSPNWLQTLMAETNWSLVIILLFSGFIVFSIFRDSPVLNRLQEPAYARGVITFLVSIAAIGLAFMFAFQAFGNASDDGFRRGREVLTGLMGVLGTIVGFYFGSSDKPVTPHFDLAARYEENKLILFASGGTPPYRLQIAFEPKEITPVDNVVLKDGWAFLPVASTPKPTKAVVEVTDAKDIKTSKSVDLSEPQKADPPNTK